MAEPEKVAAPHHEEHAPVHAAPHPEAPPPPVHEKTAPAPPPAAGAKSGDFFGVADVVLRFLLFASALVAVLVMVTSKQTEIILVTLPPFPRAVPVPVPAKFRHSPAFIYFVAALSVTGLYSLITTILSFFALLKRNMPTMLLSHLIILDVLLLGIVASATGAAGAVTYIGLKGNSHTGWTKICNRYHKFCRHIGSSVAVSLFASVVLVLLVLLNIYALSKKIPK